MNSMGEVYCDTNYHINIYFIYTYNVYYSLLLLKFLFNVGQSIK